MSTIKRIAKSNESDINIPNEPFSLWGKMVPLFDGEKWSYRIEKFEEHVIKDMKFPDEHYQFDDMKSECFFVGAYNDCNQCIGLALYRHDRFKYLYLDDLKISKAYRGFGIGKQLLDEGIKIACENGYIGLYTIGQDNNLSACLFYMKSGFNIGGYNTHIYGGTSQADKGNIYFYLDAI